MSSLEKNTVCVSCGWADKPIILMILVITDVNLQTFTSDLGELQC